MSKISFAEYVALQYGSPLTNRPERVRAIILDEPGQQFIGILRKKPNRAAYVVLPGGGLEGTDATAMAGLRREVKEELSINPSNVRYEQTPLTYDGEAFYVGTLLRRVRLVMNGPENERDPAVSGTYEPKWLPLDRLDRLNLQPPEIASRLQEAYAAWK